MSSNDSPFVKKLKNLEAGIDENSIKLRRLAINDAYNRFIGNVIGACEDKAKKGIHYIDGYVSLFVLYGDGDFTYEWVDTIDFDDTKSYLPGGYWTFNTGDLNLTKEEMEAFKKNAENEFRSLGLRDVTLTVSSHRTKFIKTEPGLFRERKK